ncbi:MAG: phosphoribosylaminoimidazolesuccinocarboxamide synthase [Nanoarchaeota archaeon]
MSLEKLTLTETNNLPIRHDSPVHNGKVRSVYWLPQEDSSRLILKEKYDADVESQVGVMVISDRISAFECIWKGESGLQGVPYKGAALNAISKYWFDQLRKERIADHHILAVPHPLVWIVERAEPVMIEAIARQYITGSMWRAYEKGEREFCGRHLPEGLQQHQRLAEMIFTPTTKGIMKGIEGVPEEEDVNISERQITQNYRAFGFKRPEDFYLCEAMVRKAFTLISQQAAQHDQIFVDTKFEVGYSGIELMFIDEVGTPDSSRMWDAAAYNQGNVVEHSKEGFRQFLLNTYDRDILLNKKRMTERRALAEQMRVPIQAMTDVSRIYMDLAEKLTGKKLPSMMRVRDEIIEALKPLGVIEQ